MFKHKAASTSPFPAVGKALALAGLAAAAVSAFVCDKTFHFQSAYEVILSGATTQSLTSAAPTALGKTMGSVTILDQNTEYKLVTDFDGAHACDDWMTTKVDFMDRKKGDAGFSPVSETKNFIKVVNGTEPFDNTPLDYWFGLASDTSNGAVKVFEVIGKAAGETGLHVWYGNAVMRKDILKRGVGTVESTLVYRFLQLNTRADSSGLRKLLTDAWKTEADNDTQRVTFKVQMIRIAYDSLPSPVGVARAAKPKDAGFRANQSGNLVLIETGAWKPGPAEPLELFNMMGQKIAALHPTGYLFQWNGKTGAGADAPTGVYFVQAGSRILGKFFYSR